jgi:uncharacterized protein
MQAITSKFKELDHYEKSLDAGYQLLPCNFISLDNSRYVLTNEIGEYLVVPREHLVSFVSNDLDPKTDFYQNLKSKHFLIDADSSVALDLLSIKLRTKMLQVSQFTGLHIFVVTLRCDHSCPYCQVSRQSEDKSAFDMSEASADKFLDFTFRSPAHALKIEFQGGEPLLNFDLIKYIVLKAESINSQQQRDLQFVIATNLALIDDEILEFCFEHKLNISTSLDGPEDLHVANRPRPGQDSYKRVIAGINRVRDALGHDQVAALMTTTKNSLGRVKDIIDEYIRQGFHSIFLRPLSPYGFAVKTKWYESYQVEEWLDFYFAGLNYIIEINKSGLRFVEDYASIILGKMFSSQGTSYVDLQSPAGVGISAIVFNYDGDVYASDEARMLAEMNDKKFRLGNIHQNTYKEMMLSDVLLDVLEESINESVPMCNDCGFKPFCGSDPVYHYATQKDVVGNKALSGFCKKNMAIMRRLIALMEDDPVARDILKSWVRF